MTDGPWVSLEYYRRQDEALEYLRRENEELKLKLKAATGGIPTQAVFDTCVQCLAHGYKRSET